MSNGDSDTAVTVHDKRSQSALQQCQSEGVALLGSAGLLTNSDIVVTHRDDTTRPISGQREFAPALDSVQAFSFSMPGVSADLAELALLWPSLPEHVKVGLLAMAKAASKKEKG